MCRTVTWYLLYVHKKLHQAIRLNTGQRDAVQGLHVGDRFTESGNDSATRDCCSILWVANPEETDFLVSMLLKDIRTSRAHAYIE